MNLHYLKSRKSLLHPLKSIANWDLYISAYDDSDRVKGIFDVFPADQKFWLALPEYGYSEEEVAGLTNCVRFASESSEADVIHQFMDVVGTEDLIEKRICVDITGFMRPHILFLVKFFHSLGIYRFDMIYTEPERYSSKENTSFSSEEILSVRQVHGFEGIHTDEMSDDILIVGVGYDDALISRIINDKDGAKVIQLLSLPSLSADMYQESVLRLDKTGASANDGLDDRVFFAPANDPFVVASELSGKIAELRQNDGLTNLYLCPLATKPQTLGFALCYMHELIGSAASILFPFSRLYGRETSIGVGRTWLYEVEL
jgi:hypothetical protein